MPAESNRNVKFTRILEYEGPPEWIAAVISASKVPIRGERQFPERGAVIRSGVVEWETATEEAAPKQPTPIHLPRPGGNP